MIPRNARMGSSLRAATPWVHPRSIYTQNVNAAPFVTPLIRDGFVETLEPDSIIPTSLPIHVGDSVLVCIGAIPFSSGNKVADNLNSLSTLPDPTNLFHVSSHVARLGNGANYIDCMYSCGFEARAYFVYFDRPNMRAHAAFSTLIDVPPYGPPTFPGVQTFTGTGTDAGMGTVTISNVIMHEYSEQGPIHIIVWPSGTAPPIGVMDTALEWMWYEWVLNNRFVIYPPLVSYQ